MLNFRNKCILSLLFHVSYVAPEIHAPPTLSAEVLQELSSTNASFFSCHPLIPSGDDMVTDGQPSTSTLNLADLKEQVKHTYFYPLCTKLILIHI